MRGLGGKRCLLGAGDGRLRGFRRRADIPKSFLGLECVDGDDSDIRHLDARGVIVALYAKGKARQDNTGFVVDTARRVIPLQLAA